MVDGKLDVIVNGLECDGVDDETGVDLKRFMSFLEEAKDIWDIVNMLMKGTELSYQDRECRLYNLFHNFAYVQGETLYEYYWRFSHLINNMHTIGMTMQKGSSQYRVSKCSSIGMEQILDEEQLAFLADPDCDDLSLAKAVLMANLSSFDPEVLSE
nr:hypothetical protein [Tanacetum cinerariifolium]